MNSQKLKKKSFKFLNFFQAWLHIKTYLVLFGLLTAFTVQAGVIKNPKQNPQKKALLKIFESNVINEDGNISNIFGESEFGNNLEGLKNNDSVQEIYLRFEDPEIEKKLEEIKIILTQAGYTVVMDPGLGINLNNIIHYGDPTSLDELPKLKTLVGDLIDFSRLTHVQFDSDDAWIEKKILIIQVVDLELVSPKENKDGYEEDPKILYNPW